MAADYQQQYDMDFWMDGPDNFDDCFSMPSYLNREYDDLAETSTPQEEEDVPTWPTTLTNDKSLPKKKAKLSEFREKEKWLKHLLEEEYAPESLRESSAKQIAASWLTMDELKAQLQSMETMGMCFEFQAEIGVHFKGEALAYFITQEGGLLSLVDRCWSEVFQRLLVSVYREMSFLGKTRDIKGRRQLAHCIRLFRESARETTSFALLSVHRLGLTYLFEKKNRQHNDERPILEYYDAQDQRYHRTYYYPKLVYPLPPVLQLNKPSIKMSGDYAPNTIIRDERNKRRRQIEQDTFWNEERGKVLSQETQQHRQDSYHINSQWFQVSTQSLLSRHFLLLTMMVYAHLSHSPQQVIVAALLALTHPFYSGSGMRHEDPERMRKVTQAKIDIYWYLGKALCSVHAKMDLPLACLYMAQCQVKRQPLICISELARVALLKMEIFLRYGMYHQARDLFGEWFQRLPCSSWLYEEFVMMYCAGVFYELQDMLVEIHLTELVHVDCDKLACFSIHVEPMLRSVSNQLFLLKSILHSCLSNLTSREDFRSDCKNALQLCIFYHFTVMKIGYRHCNSYCGELKNIYEQINWNYSANETSHHLEPFFTPLPYSVQSEMFWKEMFRRAESQDWVEWQKKSGCQDVRVHAEYRFTLLVSGLFHRSSFRTMKNDVTEWTEATLKMYRGCTGHRHHRVKLLEKLHYKLLMGPKVNLEGGSLVTQQELYQGLPTNQQDLNMELDAYPNLHHPKMTQSQLSAQHLTRHYIQEFATTTMRDCLSDFEYQNFSTDEVFCAYLRKRDSSVMDRCIQTGLTCFRFA